MTEAVAVSNISNQNNCNYIYPIDVFMKYRDMNRETIPNFEKYHVESLTSFKFKKQDIFDRQDLKIKLNYILTKQDISGDDENLYKMMMKVLNKVNNNMLTQNQNKNNSANANANNNDSRIKENSLQYTIDTLTSIGYTKVEHYQKLAELMIDKALNEPTFCTIYAILCYELSQYYIELSNGKTVYFRHVLLNICQSTFETFLNNYENVERIKLIGLMRFLGELYIKGLLPSVIMKGCFDRLSVLIDKAPNIAEGISELVILTYKSLLKDQNCNVAVHIKNKLNTFIDNNKLNLKSKFAIQNALDKIAEVEKIK